MLFYVRHGRSTYAPDSHLYKEGLSTEYNFRFHRIQFSFQLLIFSTEKMHRRISLRCVF